MEGPKGAKKRLKEVCYTGMGSRRVFDGVPRVGIEVLGAQ